MRLAVAVVLAMNFLCTSLVTMTFAAANQTVGQFLSECAKDAGSACQEDINAAEAAYGGEDLGICDPSNNSGASDSSVEQETGAIVDWLNSHPETHDMAEFDGIVAALKALYSC